MEHRGNKAVIYVKILQILAVNLLLVLDTSGVALASGTDLIASKELGKAIEAIQ